MKSRAKKVNWQGGLSLDKGRILSFEEFAFDQSDEGVKKISNQILKWKSTTSGDPDGVILALDAPDDAKITFFSKPKTFSFELGNITEEPMIVHAGGINQKVKVSVVSAKKGPRDVEFKYRDDGVKEGVNPYWVRVVQWDGTMAWSSPIFVKYR